MPTISELNLSERVLRLIYDAMLPAYESAEQRRDDAQEAFDAANAALAEAQVDFDEVRENMGRIRRALYPLTVVYIRSNTYPDTQYKVTLDRANGNRITCECQSFRFERGLVNGTCKHIRRAINERGLLDNV